MNVENVFRVAALSVFLMFFAVLIFFKEPKRAGEKQAMSFAEVAENFGTVISNPRFMLFLLIFSGYWIVYWQEFIILPLYVSKYINPAADTDKMLSIGPILVICLTVALNALTQKTSPVRAITIGTVRSAVAWVFLIISASLTMAYVALALVALGEIIQSPKV